MISAQHRATFIARLQTADSTGFYTIPLTAAILAKSNARLTDLRLKDAQGKEVPFVLDDIVKNTNTSEQLVNFPIREKLLKKDGKRHVIVEVRDKLVTDLILRISNSMASRSINISGSNDGEEWFIVKENVLVSRSERHDSNSYRIVVRMPSTNYNYFDITFNEEKLLPVNILEAGSLHTDHAGTPTLYDTIMVHSVTQTDSSNHITYAKLLLTEAFPISAIAFDISGARYFRRAGFLHSRNNPGYDFTLSSDSALWLTIDCKTADLRLEVYNEDNPPLVMNAARILVKKVNVYAFLEKGNNYRLEFGDSLATAPVYDLVYFKNLIRANTPAVVILGIEKNNVEAQVKPVTDLKKIYIWGAIFVVLALLFLFTYKLAKDVKKRDV